MNKTLNHKTFNFSVIYELAPEGGYIASIPVLPGCHTQGETLEEAEANIKEAATVYLESLLENNEIISRESRILQGKVEIAM